MAEATASLGASFGKIFPEVERGAGSMTPRGHAIAFRIWQHCKPCWDCTLFEVADALDVPVATVRAVIKLKGWGGRLRSTKVHYRGAGGNSYAASADQMLDGVSNSRLVDQLTGGAS